MSGTRKRRAGAAAVTANRLTDGRVVWRTAGGGWSAAFEDAAVLASDTLDLALAEALADEARQIVVGSYAAPLDAGAAPASWRERIRAFGPSLG